jgi:penicillin G amidase
LLLLFSLSVPWLGGGDAAAEVVAGSVAVLGGPTAPVRIVRDGEGIPHVFARSDRDAYFAMGYLHARDRLFQIDHSRRLFSGTLAEILGREALPGDIQLRTLGLRRAAEESWMAYSPEVRHLIEAYSEGINAALDAPDFEPPLEYERLEISSIEPWDPIDTLTVIKGLAFGLSFDLGDISRTEVFDAYIEAGLDRGFDGAALFSEDLFRSAPFDPAVSISEASHAAVAGVRMAEVPRTPSTGTGVSRSLIRKFLEKARGVPLLDAALRTGERFDGSNFWIVGPEHSATGNPLLANDPHLSLQAPAIFYEIHLVVDGDPASGAMNVTGVSFPGAPGVVQGCNERICWGSTVNPMDVTDVFEERLDFVPAFPPQNSQITGTLFEGGVEPVVAIPQVFRANQTDNGVLDDIRIMPVGPLEGGVTYLVPRRNRGPIVAVDIDESGVRGLSVQFAGWRATREGEFILRAARAQDPEDFKRALQYFDFGSQNWAYADVDGNIAYFTSGELPLREDLESGAVSGRPPWFVRDGTGGVGHEWLPVEEREPVQALDYRILPYGEMPQVENPPEGFIISANNDPVGVSLDNDPLSRRRPGGGLFYLNPGFTSVRMGRLDRVIRETVAAHPGGVTLETIEAIQADNRLLDAEVFVPHILRARVASTESGAPGVLRELGEDSWVGEAVERLAGWNFTTPTGIREGFDPGDDPEDLPDPNQEEIDNSVAATIYAVWRSRFIANTIDAVLDRNGLSGHRPDSERSLSALRRLLEDFEDAAGVGRSGLNFFEVEGVVEASRARDTIILRSLREALDRLASSDFATAFGGSTHQEDYRWGRLHRVRFDHPLGGAFSIPRAGGFEHLSPALPGLARSGGYEVVDASSHSARADAADRFMFGSGPARRFVAELNPAGIRAFQIIPGGPSGRIESDRYASQIGRWLTNHYHELPLSREDVELAGVSEEVLAPPDFRLYFPYLEGDALSLTGLAVANVSGVPEDLDFIARSDHGSPLDLPLNPSSAVATPGGQLARLGNELFGAPDGEAYSGWVELISTLSAEIEGWPPVAGFAQYGDFALHELDGAVAGSETWKRIFFTRIYSGPGGFRGWDAETRLALVNPHDGAAAVRLRLRSDATGAPIGEEVERIIPARGRLFETVADLFGPPPTRTYLEVEVLEGRGILGFSLIRLPGAGTVIGMNGSPGGGASRMLYSAQLAATPSVFTSLKVVNVAETSRVLRMTALPAEGAARVEAAPLALGPGEARELDAGELFAAGEALIGSLKIEVDGDGVIGDVVFGDPHAGRFAAALPLQIEPFRRAVFGHVANLGDFFTGLALFNPGGKTAAVEIEVVSPQGVRIGGTVQQLDPERRLSRTLEELVPETAGQAGGVIWVRSDVPIVAQELFGAFDLRLQSAVPPTVLK